MSLIKRTWEEGKRMRLGKDAEKRLKKMSPSQMLKLYGHLLMVSQRYSVKHRHADADELRREAEQILIHFQKTLD